MAEVDLITKVEKYVKQLKNEDKIGHALARLDRIDMTIELLSVTNVGKVVNRLRDHEVFGEEATRIVEKWKDTARKNGIRPKNEREERERKFKNTSGSCEEASRKRQRSPYDEATSSKTSQPKTSKPSVSTTFEQMLCSADNVAVKTRKPKPVDWSKQRPEIDLNYRPLPVMNHVTKPVVAPVVEEEEFNPEKMFKPRNDRVKVFAGKKKGLVLAEVPTLFQSCLRVIGNNINAIEETGDIPFDILRPVLEKCTPQQLMYIEMRNPYLEEDSDCLWERLVAKHFPGKHSDDDGETWKEAFFRLEKEKEDKLKHLSIKIGTSHKDAADKGQRKAMFADAKAPRDVRKRQIRHGTGHTSCDLPSAVEVSSARRKIFETGGSKDSLATLPKSVVNRNSMVGAKKDGKKPMAKKGALMMKTMKMLNMKRR